MANPKGAINIQDFELSEKDISFVPRFEDNKKILAVLGFNISSSKEEIVVHNERELLGCISPSQMKKGKYVLFSYRNMRVEYKTTIADAKRYFLNILVRDYFGKN